MNGGIYNAALFGASQREARGKLEQMAGIKRPPSGILASSPELMQAAMPAPRAMMPQQPMPAPMPMVQPALPQVPAPTAMAAPVQQPVQQAPAPRPTAPAPQPPVMMKEGGAVNEQFRGYSEMGERLARKAKESNSMVVDITQDPVAFLEQMDAETDGAVTNTFGSIDKALQEGTGKANSINAALDTGSAENVANTVIDQAGLPLNDESKKEFASTVLNLDTDDIGEIDDAIFRTLTADVTLSGKELQKAVLLGLQNYKQTASARAAAKSGGSGMSPLEPFPDAVRDLAGKIMTATGEDPAVAIQQARDALAPYYTGQAGPTTTETTETATVTIEQHKSANDAAKQAGQKTYTLGGQEFQVQ